MPPSCSTASSRRAAARGAPTAADSAALRAALPGIVASDGRRRAAGSGRAGPTQCHDITVYPAIGLAGGACEGYGLLLDISDPAHPKRHRRGRRLELLLLALGDVQQRRHQDPVLRRVGRRRRSRSAARPTSRSGAPTRSSRIDEPARCSSRATTSCRRRRPTQENCVAHNGSLIPIPGRDVMVQAWYQGGISVFDWTDPDAPEGDRVLRPRSGGLDRSWRAAAPGRPTGTTAYIVSSEIARGLDVFELHAERVHLAERDRRGEVGASWTTSTRRVSRSSSGRPSFALARAYLDQLERSKGLDGGQITRDARGAGRRREGVRRAAGRAQQARLAARVRLWIGDRRGQGSHLDRDGTAAGRGAGGGTRRGHSVALCRLLLLATK